MNEKTVVVPGINCGHCVATIKREVGELDGVASVDADAETKNVTVHFGPPADWPHIAALLGEIGFPPRD